MIKSPCKYCDERHSFCHSKCAAYQQYKQDLEQLHQAERQALKDLSAQIRANVLVNKNQYYGSWRERK